MSAGRNFRSSFKLTVPKGSVEAALLHKRIVVALLDDVAVLHYQNDVGLPNGGQTVGHDEGGAPLHQLGKGLLDLLLSAGVDGGGGLVQNQQRRQAEQRHRRSADART